MPLAANFFRKVSMEFEVTDEEMPLHIPLQCHNYRGERGLGCHWLSHLETQRGSGLVFCLQKHTQLS
jgi:hypothetical protein